MSKIQFVMNYIWVVALSLLFSTHAFAQPTIDGIFDGAATWGSPITTADAIDGWADASAKNIYFAQDDFYIYLGAEVKASTWMNWVFILNTGTGGGATDTWSRSIDYNHTDAPNYVLRGHFNDYAQFHSWNGTSWDGVGTDASTDDFGENISTDLQDGWVEVRYLKSNLNGATAVEVQFYITGDNNDHGSFDAAPDDNNAVSWNESSNRTSLSNYSSSQSIGAGSSIVTATPALPSDNQQVVIDFDASSTALAGASKVYLHSGVSTNSTDPLAFSEVVGNWGQDDGIGEMTDMGDDNWQITMTSLRNFYGVAVEDDIFGINYLFRSADGTMIEDASGSNYHTVVDPGNFFTLDSPSEDPFLVEINTTFSVETTASAIADWTLEEVDANGNNPTSVTTQMAVNAFSYNMSQGNTNLTYYKLTADFGGTIKSKLFSVKAFSAVTEMARPVGMQPGINYHENDATKATLILHVPTYTQYKKGDGTVSGMGNTSEKEVVYVIGDFNNWTLDDAYIMKRDRDGWNGVTDADNDDDRGDYWWIELDNLTPGQAYVFQYYIDGGTQIADPYTEQVSDPDDNAIGTDRYPNLITYPAQAVDRASVLQTDQAEYVWTAPSFDRPTNNKLNIYELHFRDFTEEGTYLAAIDHLDYLKNMGINAIHVMPVSEFEGNSSWGYNPNFYFAPDKYYGTKNDLKKFIDECHKLEIQVFNDLVLNHSFHSNVMVKMFQETSSIAPSTENPWLNNAHKMVRNTAGHWGADWNHESEHTQEMIDRALDFWLQEYNFDGYRFDFTKGFGQTNPEDFPQGDDWASAYNQARVDLLERMVDGMWARNPGSVAIFEHLANATEDKALADEGILMWSGVGHHNDMKGFIMGWPNDNRDIYNSGIYNASGRNFDLQNWMSYMESHDEERLAYELMQFGNGIATEIDEEVKLAKTIDRLKIGAAFNMLFPGPRMIWQFGELGYDYSINFNGRTGEKPVRWDYFQDAKRKELYDLYSTLLNIRNNHYSVYNDINYRNIGAGQEAISTPRVMQLSSGIADNHSESVIVIANLDPNAQQTTTPNYPVAGTWYKYNGDPSIDGTTYTVNNTSDTYTLQPSETLVLTNFQVQFPAALAVAGLTFNGKVENGHAQLNWNTQSEIDNHGFYIEKSLDGEQFADLQFVTGQGTTTKTQFYQFSDNKFKTAAYYRLRQVDLAGKVTYSNVVYLQANATQTPQFSLAPNPWTNDSQLQLDQTATGMITLELVNTAGVVLQRSQGDLTQVNADLRKSLQQATTGTYFARVFNAGKVQVLRIVR